MTIRVIPDPGEIVLTASEHAHLQREWQAACAFTTRPPTFEEFVRSRMEYKKLAKGLHLGKRG